MMSKRYEKYDFLRGLAIIGVVLIHITAPFATDGDLFSIVVNQVSRFAVPVFFFLSGWGLTIADSWGRSDGYWDFLKKRLASVVPQYLIWNIIYLFYTDVWSVPLDFDVTVFQELLRAFLLGTVYNHLYFVPVIIVFYIAYPLLVKISNKYGVVISLFISVMSQFSELWIEHEIFHMNKNILNWLFYFILGIWVSDRFEAKTKAVQKYKTAIVAGTIISMFIVLSTPFVIGELFDYNLALASTRPSVIFYSVMVILLVMVTPWTNQVVKRILILLSKYSFYIYLSHYLFVSIFREIYLELGWNLYPAVYVLVSFVLVMAISLVVGRVTQRIEKGVANEEK